MRKALVKGFAFTILLVFALMLVGGCAGPTANLPGAPGQQATAQDSPRTVAYKSLVTMSKTYTATMKSIADLHKQGLVDDTVKAKAIKYGDAFKEAHDLAITAVEVGGDFSVAGVSKALAKLLEFAQPYLVKAVA